MDLDCVASFLVLVHERHFGRAAAHLNLTTSALTKRLQRLEAQVGARLLDRGPGGVVKLTRSGSSFHLSAQLLLDASVRAKMAARGDRPQHMVRLGLPGALGDYPRRAQLKELVTQLNQSHPDVKLACYGIPYRMLESALETHLVDVIMTMGDAWTSQNAYAVLAPFQRVGLVPKGHSMHELSAVDVGVFSEERMLVDYGLPCSWADMLCLGDVRPLTGANLVGVTTGTTAAVISHLRRNECVTVSLASFRAFLPADLTVIELLGSPLMTFKAVRRIGDKREPILAVVAHLTEMLSKTWAG